jgi:hypothetical protein
MPTSSRTRARRTGAPAAALLGTSQTPRNPVAPSALQPEEQPDFGPLPPLPSAPPPLPPGTRAGFDDLPEGAVAAEPLVVPEDADLTPSDVPVDPVTGEEAEIPDVTRAGASEELRAELDAAARIREAEEARDAAIAELEALRANAPMDLEGANDLGGPQIGGLGPAGQIDPADHRAAQARYRAFRQQQLVNGPPPAAAPEAPAVPTETAEDRSIRLRAEARAEYERRVAAMPEDEPRYRVGPRGKRPKVAGHTLEVGDVVPGAAYFPRLSSWTDSGMLVKEGS